MPDTGPDVMAEGIRFDRRGRAGWVTLARPQALNALSHAMARALHRQLDEWSADPSVAFVVIEGEGRAFCAGGDIQAIHAARQAPLFSFFADEYRLNAAIARYPKPYVALIDGIDMGGGVGVSVHGSHRVVTGNAIFAMPEVGIGFFPDVGGSHFLPRLRGRTGWWMGLTGTRLRWGDCLRSGIATHAVAADDLPALKGRLGTVGHPDEALAAFAARPEPETPEVIEAGIDACFTHTTVEDILAALDQREGEDWASKAATAMRRHSPTSLKVAQRQITRGARLTMGDCMRMEFRIVSRMLTGDDFYEGIRAAVIDKGASPQWRPATLAEVSDADVDRYFADLGANELALP